MTAAAISLAIGIAWGWFNVSTGWGVNFPSQRPPRAFRLAVIALLCGCSLWLGWYFYSLLSH